MSEERNAFTPVACTSHTCGVTTLKGEAAGTAAAADCSVDIGRGRGRWRGGRDEGREARYGRGGEKELAGGAMSAKPPMPVMNEEAWRVACEV